MIGLGKKTDGQKERNIEKENHQVQELDEDNKWFGWSDTDDSTFKPREQPERSNGTIDYNWYVCWQYFSGYYYNSVGWSLYGAPKNPTCEHVDITRVML